MTSSSLFPQNSSASETISWKCQKEPRGVSHGSSTCSEGEGSGWKHTQQPCGLPPSWPINAKKRAPLSLGKHGSGLTPEGPQADVHGGLIAASLKSVCVCARSYVWVWACVCSGIHGHSEENLGCLCSPKDLGTLTLQMSIAVHYVSYWSPDWGPYSWVASALPTKPSH